MAYPNWKGQYWDNCPEQYQMLNIHGKPQVQLLSRSANSFRSCLYGADSYQQASDVTQGTEMCVLPALLSDQQDGH